MQPEMLVSCLLGGFWGTTNVPEDMQGRRLVLPDTGGLSGSGPSCCPPVYFRGGRKALVFQVVRKGWAKPLGVSSVPRRSKALEGGTRTTPRAGDLYQGQSIFRVRYF